MFSRNMKISVGIGKNKFCISKQISENERGIFNKIFYEPKDGLAMSSPLRSLPAEFFMSYTNKFVNTKYIEKIMFGIDCGRYLE